MNLIKNFRLNLKTIATLIICVVAVSSCSREIDQLEAISSFQYPVPSLIAADISNDATIVALLSPDELSVWSVKTNKLINNWNLTHFEEHQYYISLSINKKFAAIASKNKVTIFNIWTKEIVSTWEIAGFSPLSKITSLKFNENGEQFYIGMNEGSIVKVDLKLKTKSIFQLHSSNVNFIELSDIGEYALTASVDGSIEYFNTVTGEILSSFKANTRITSLVLDNRSTHFFYSDALNTHQVIDLNNSTVISTLNYIERFRYFRKGVFINHGKTLFNSTPKSQLAVWDLKTGKQIQKGSIRSRSFGSTVLDVALQDDNDIVTISSDGIVEAWNTRPHN